MENIAKLSDQERVEIFNETANNIGTTTSVVEKDFWVVWVLARIFSNQELKNIFMFKGGTSLSKVFKLIKRFSEDIDLVLNWDVFKPQYDPSVKSLSKTKQDQFNQKLNLETQKYIKEHLLNLISIELSPYCNCSIYKEDPHSINIEYPSLTKSSYLRPNILLEIGALASWSPASEFKIESFVAEEFPDLFTQKSCTVNTILAKRTFWEKATILHREAMRSQEKLIPARYSRHYYDLALMADSSAKEDALQDQALREEVIEFKKRFYPQAWAKYDQAKTDGIKLIPKDYRIKELENDYKAMQEMIFGDEISFNTIITRLKLLEKEIHAL